ncbi:[protein-PII] uridylyltransferase family protein [Fodinicola feengrottensis]|uniref:[protein-PII] uridylyltransferase family protein n=1 Tax=Fodinicola feengrottensis TaxID=435914 RepID=UPI002441C130|nr:hypothetical protein [Fodinicola feengrottensis]
MKPSDLEGEDISPAGRRAIAGRLDWWLAGLLPDVPGLALVAVGSLGRYECVPGSDVDLVLVHDGLSTVATIADQLWYPIWDSGISLDHSVRTLKQATKVAGEDVRAALGMLDARYVAGDQALADAFGGRLREAWRANAAKNLTALRESTLQRWESFGELAFLLEGDLKEARGGLRDQLAIRGAGYAQVAQGPSVAARDAYQRMLDVRQALHEATGRGKDTLRLQEQETVAERLGLDGTDARCCAGSPTTPGASRTRRTPAGWRSSDGPPASAAPACCAAAAQIAGRWPTAWSNRTARWCWPGRRRRTPTRCCRCGSPRPPPPRGCRSAPTRWPGWPVRRPPWRCRGHRRRGRLW